MLPKVNRFSFKRRVPQKIYTSPFFVVRHERKSENILSCAVVVGKKIDNGSVVRNKIKRQLIELIEEIFTRQAPLTIVVYAKKAVKNAEKEELTREVKKIFDTLNKQ